MVLLNYWFAAAALSSEQITPLNSSNAQLQHELKQRAASAVTTNCLLKLM
jgi:hypothetical protein